jgi:hypothetical protein
MLWSLAFFSSLPLENLAMEMGYAGLHRDLVRLRWSWLATWIDMDGYLP